MAEFILPAGGGTIEGTDGNDVFVVDPRNQVSVVVTDLGGNDTLRILDSPERDAGQFFITTTELVWRSMQGGEVRFVLGANRIGKIEWLEWELTPGDASSRVATKIVTAPAPLTEFLVSYAGTERADTITDRGIATVSGGWTDIYGNGGNDRLTASGQHTTYLYGGTGNDTLSASTKGQIDDYFFGDDGNDLLRGWAGDDFLYGGNGSDRIEGGTATDSLDGDTGNDSLFGGAGADYLDGGDGRDLMEGSDGNDYLFGGAGADMMRGGRGSDVFIYEAVTDSLLGRANRDQILDFDTLRDTIDLRNLDADALVDGEQDFSFDTDGELTTGEVRLTVDNAGTLVQIETGARDGIDMEILLKNAFFVGNDAFFL